MTSIRRLAALVVVAAIVLTAGALVTGRIAHVTTNGVSMEPTHSAGDLVVVGRSESYDVDQIVAFRIPGDDTLVLHRIISGDDTRFTIQGDNNESIDPYQPAADEIVGRELLHVPRLGALIASPFTRAAVLAALIFLGVMFMRTKQSPRDTAAETPTGTARTRIAWKMLVTVDIALIVALGLAQLATMQDKSSPDTEVPPTQTAELAYHATVDRSSNYPTGAIATGDPVFTQLVDRVEVDFRHRTDTEEQVTGTAQFDLTLSTSSGWETTRRLVRPTSIESGDLNTTLVLSDIEALTDEVAEATGMPTGTVHITVTASGEASHRGAEPVDFSVDLPLELTPSTMTLTAETTPTPHGPAVVSETPLTRPALERGQSETLDPRTALLAALLLAIAATVVFWPTTEDPANANPTTRVQALTVQLPTTTPRVTVADRGDLQTIATTAGRPIIIGDGWEGTLTADALYWSDTTTTERAAPLKPDHHPSYDQAHTHVPLAPTMSDAN